MRGFGMREDPDRLCTTIAAMNIDLVSRGFESSVNSG